jgi:hypothetical protein
MSGETDGGTDKLQGAKPFPPTSEKENPSNYELPSVVIADVDRNAISIHVIMNVNVMSSVGRLSPTPAPGGETRRRRRRRRTATPEHGAEGDDTSVPYPTEDDDPSPSALRRTGALSTRLLPSRLAPSPPPQQRRLAPSPSALIVLINVVVGVVGAVVVVVVAGVEMLPE